MYKTPLEVYQSRNKPLRNRPKWKLNNPETTQKEKIAHKSNQSMCKNKSAKVYIRADVAMVLLPPSTSQTLLTRFFNKLLYECTRYSGGKYDKLFGREYMLVEMLTNGH